MGNVFLTRNGKYLTRNGKFLKRVTPDTATKTGYGALYNWWVTQAPLITGFRCPNDGEWNDLITTAGGASVAGGKLKSTRTDPTIAPRFSINNVATDDYGLSLFAGGDRSANGSFSAIEILVEIWSKDENANPVYANGIDIADDENGVLEYVGQKENGLSIRQIRDLTTSESLLTDGTFLAPVQDYDGNYYEVVKIGNYAWTAQNLRATHFADGTLIPNVIDNTEWFLTTPAYCWYDNDINTPGIVFTDEFITL